MEEACVDNELQKLSLLVDKLKQCEKDGERIQILNSEPRIMECLASLRWLPKFCSALAPEGELILKSLMAIDQFKPSLRAEDLPVLLEDLAPVEVFYKEMGGIVGYHCKMLSSFCFEAKEREKATYHRPPGIAISSQSDFVLEGIVSLPFLAEIYPVGGAADRLKFEDNGHALPAAHLPFCGYTLLERLIRDVQAREYLYYKLFGEQVTIPIAMMTSHEKHNHDHILELCEKTHWFGRPKDSFRIFCQPAVPTMDKKGNWCWSGKAKLLMKPGGHGAIWKVAQQEGVFDWMRGLGCRKILIRQINNPIAGIDLGLLAFCGVGFKGDKAFGFASCPRQVGSAEGIDVLIERKGRYCLTNIEYCDFSRMGIEDAPVEPGSPYSRFPSNTNILFADIDAVEEAIQHCPIPGMIVNFKKMSFVDETGHTQEKEIARLESTMQNLADYFEQDSEMELKTYLTYGPRQKTISTVKKLLHEGQSLLETPEGCCYDFLRNAHDLLTNHCGMRVPPIDPNGYLAPPFLFQYHPALGPLFSIIGQKIRGGSLSLHSELKLEIAEVDIEHLTLSGSLHITAAQPIGEGDDLLAYSDRVGNVYLRNVIVENLGFDAAAENIYWKEEIQRRELCAIHIYGDGEFVAENVVLRGNRRIEVPAGHRVTATEENGVLKLKKEVLTGSKKTWIYHLADDGSISLE